jgi:putative copper export protein
LTGHTSTGYWHWLLVPLLLTHLLIVAFWFGSLWPLCLVTLRESRERAARVVTLFSSAAFWLVPLILAAGVAIAVLLLSSFAALWHPYGELLIAKIGLFAVLLGLAAFNKWRFGPALGNGDLQAGKAFRRMVITEYVLIVVVFAVTAVLTTFFSPE